jgi:branched-chain amino acid transport system ATP-binding protein
MPKEPMAKLHHQAGSPAAMRPREPVLEIRSVTAGYGDLAAARDVSIVLYPGEIVALFGANGAGKTTTLLATVGVLARIGGQVLWQGAPSPKALHRLARVGLAFVPGGSSVITRLSTRDNLRLGPGGIDRAVGYFPELTRLLDRPAGLLSGGEQQIVAMARALAARPKVLLVDELSMGLAPLVVDRLLAALRHAADTEGLAVLLVEQQVRRVLTVADRWYLLSNSTLTDSGRADEHAQLESSYLGNMRRKRPAES